MPASARSRLHNLWAVAPGQSPDAIVVMAHRDDTGVGPGANDNATGTAALVELARDYAQAAPGPGACAPRTRSSSSRPTAARSAGSAPLRFAEHSPFHVVAASTSTRSPAAGRRAS